MDFDSQEGAEGNLEYEEVEAAENTESGSINSENDSRDSLSALTASDLQMNAFSQIGMLSAGIAVAFSLGVALLLKLFRWNQ